MIILNSTLFNENISLKAFFSILLFLFSAYILFQTIIQYNTNKKSNKFLIFIVFLLLIISFIELIYNVYTQASYYLLFLFVTPTIFLSPSVYLYIKSLTTQNFEFNRKEKVHFAIPVILISIALLLNLLLMASFHLNLIKAVNFFADVFIILSITIFYILPLMQFLYYGFKTISIYSFHIKNFKNYFSNAEEVEMKWIKYFIIVYIVHSLIFILLSMQIEVTSKLYDVIYYSELFLFIFFLGFYGTKQTDIYQKKLSFVTSPYDINQETIELVKSNSYDNFVSSTSFISEDKKDEIQSKLLQLIQEEKIYRHPSLNINDIVQKTGSNQKYISTVINERFNKNFLTFINEYRIKDAKELLKNDKANQYTVEGIGNMVGFNSRSAFINAFKKIEGTTPSAYKESVEIQ